jgi:predicted small metal-binding protein
MRMVGVTASQPNRNPEALESATMIKQIVCDCGWTARGTEDELVEAAQVHGREAHDMVPTREQVLAVATPASENDYDGED